MKKNVNYVLYGNNDEYIAGFDTIKQIQKFLDYSSSRSLIVMFSQRKNEQGEENRYLTIENNFEWEYECSKLMMTFQRDINLENGNKIEKGSKIYKFWTEDYQ